MLSPRSVFLALGLLILCAGAAGAQTQTSPFDISWSALDPGDDWSWQMLQSVFPINGQPPTNTGAAATLIGTLLGQITGLTMALAMSFLCYITIINIHRVAESAQILTGAMTSMAAVRIGFAAIMMFPLQSGFSVGQAAVMQVAGWGIGMARSLYANAVQAIGPDAMVIADPIIPGARTLVLDLIQVELCRSLVNQAAGTTLIQPPTPTLVNSGKGAVITYAYQLTPGNPTGSDACGSVSVADSSATPATLGSVTIDMATQQNSILQGIVSSIQPQIDAIAQSYWQNKTQASLAPLLGLYQTTTQSYTQQLTAAAQAITAATQGEHQRDRRPHRQSGLKPERGPALHPRLDLGGRLLPRLRSPQRPHPLARQRRPDRQHADLRGSLAVAQGRYRAPFHRLELVPR